MSAFSQNGWPVSPNEADLDITPLVVGGVEFSPGVRGGKVHEILSYVAHAVHTRVQQANSTYGCWGYSYRENVNSPGEWSNHASGTAIDFNATKHPNAAATATNWTPAQIAEIHKILDEVGNVVRWGGDYEGTPDAMHFEINVPPSELDVALPDADVPKASTVWPIGVQFIDLDNLQSMPELTTMSVSYPTQMAYTHGQAGWVFRPTRSGQLSFDALLSHYHDAKYWTSEGPQVWLDLYEVDRAYGWPGRFLQSSSWFEGGFGYPERNQGRFLYDVEAGKEYILYTGASQSFPYIRTVVRIGDYAEEPGEWQDPPLRTREWLIGGDPNSPGMFSNQSVISAYADFRGGDVDIYRSFGSPPNHPTADDNAVQCSWHYSRKAWADTGVVWWGPGGSGTYNGGPGSCVLLTLVDTDSNGGQSVGYEFYADHSGLQLLNDLRWYVRAYSLKTAAINFINYETSYGTEVWPPSYWPSDLEGQDWVETEAGGLTLESLDVRWNTAVGSDQPYDDGLIVKWYMGQVEGGPDANYNTPPHPVGKWGPWNGAWYGQSGDSPENWAASQDHMGDSSGYDVGTWKPVPMEWLEPFPDAYGGQIWPEVQFTVMSNEMMVEQHPSLPGLSVGTSPWSYDYTNLKVGLTIEARSVFRLPRFRVHRDPGIEDIAWAGVGAITLSPSDAGQVFFDRGVTPVQHGI